MSDIGIDDTRVNDPKTPAPGSNVIERVTTDTKRPSMWHVVVMNDDFTPMDFVVFLLMKVFSKSHTEAEAITFQIHIDGKGIAGTYTYEVAETKAVLSMDMARVEGHPLLLKIEPVPDA